MDESSLSGLLQHYPPFFFMPVERNKRLQEVSKLLISRFSLIFPTVNKPQIYNNVMKKYRIEMCLIQGLGRDVDLCTPVAVALILCHKLVNVHLIYPPF